MVKVVVVVVVVSADEIEKGRLATTIFIISSSIIRLLFFFSLSSDHCFWSSEQRPSTCVSITLSHPLPSNRSVCSEAVYNTVPECVLLPRLLLLLLLLLLQCSSAQREREKKGRHSGATQHNTETQTWLIFGSQEGAAAASAAVKDEVKVRDKLVSQKNSPHVGI